MSVGICLSLTMQLNCLKFIITGEVCILYYQVTSNPLKTPEGEQELLIVQQILLDSNIGNVWRMIMRICILIIESRVYSLSRR